MLLRICEVQVAWYPARNRGMVQSSAPNCQKLHYTWKGKQLCFLWGSVLCHLRMKSYHPPLTAKVKVRILHLKILLPWGFLSRWISFDQRCLFYAIILIIIISFIKKENKKDVVLVLAQRSTLSEILPYPQLVARLLRQEDASTQDQCLARRRHASHGQVCLRCKNQNLSSNPLNLVVSFSTSGPPLII